MGMLLITGCSQRIITLEKEPNIAMKQKLFLFLRDLTPFYQQHYTTPTDTELDILVQVQSYTNEINDTIGIYKLDTGSIDDDPDYILIADNQNYSIYDRANFNGYFKHILKLYENSKITSKQATDVLEKIIMSSQNRYYFGDMVLLNDGHTCFYSSEPIVESIEKENKYGKTYIDSCAIGNVNFKPLSGIGEINVPNTAYMQESLIYVTNLCGMTIFGTNLGHGRYVLCDLNNLNGLLQNMIEHNNGRFTTEMLVQALCIPGFIPAQLPDIHVGLDYYKHIRYMNP